MTDPVPSFFEAVNRQVGPTGTPFLNFGYVALDDRGHPRGGRRSATATSVTLLRTVLADTDLAGASVLERWLTPSRYPTGGERVVQGQRLMQATSDIFLGWATAPTDGRSYYWRQLHDMKGSADLETISARGLRAYAELCGWSLARAHARSGSPVAISAYLGSSSAFDDAVTEFALAYADQNEADFTAHERAIAEGRVTAHTGV